MGTCQTSKNKKADRNNLAAAKRIKQIRTLSYTKNIIDLDDRVMGTLQNMNKIFFISSTTDSNDNIIKINSYNIETKQILNSLYIKCNDYDIDIKHCSYCLDNKNNKIYLINNNKQIIAISINNQTLKLLNTINTQQQQHKINNNNKNISNADNSNFATITYRNDKVMVFGAIPKTEHKDDDNIIYIPFDLKSQQKHNKQEYAIKEFGKNTKVLNLQNYALLLGGETSNRQNREHLYPTNIIWRCQLYTNNNNISHAQYQWDGQYYLPESMHSFGVINLDLGDIRYIVIFGGTHVVKNRNSNIYEEQPMRTIYALYLNKKHENTLINEYDDSKEKEEDKDHGKWLELDCKLPKRGNFYAIYDKDIDGINIHLISYGGTRCVHYIVSMDDIKDCLMNKQYDECPPWIEKGKTTHSLPIRLDIKSQIDLPNNTMLTTMKSQTSKQSMEQSMECSIGIYPKQSMETVQHDNIDQDVLDPVVIDEMKEIAEKYVFHDTNWSHLVTSCPKGNGGDAGSGKAAGNYSNNNNRKTQRDNNHNNNNVNNGGGDVGGGGGRRNGRDDGDDDEKKRNEDKYKDMIADNDEDNEEEEEEEEEESEYKLNADAPSFTPRNTLPPIFERICKEKEKSKEMDLKMMKTTKKVLVNKRKNEYCYDPNIVHRAEGNIVISRKLTQSVIPGMIKECLGNLWEYINKTTAIQFNNIVVVNNGSVKIINYDFHDKNRNEILYAVIQYDGDNNIWRMKDKLYFGKELENEYGIYSKELPKSERTSTIFTLQLSQIGRIRNLIMNKDEINKLIKKIKWNKVPVLNKKQNRKRITLSLDKQEFTKSLLEFVNINDNKIHLIPILVFNQSMDNNDIDNRYRIEHIWMVHIDINISIGISFIYNNNNNNKWNGSVIVTGIHLDRTYIANQHELVLPDHDCHCLDNFKSCIDDLSIGHPDDDMNTIINLKTELKKRNKDLKHLRKENETLRTALMSLSNKSIDQSIKSINLSNLYNPSTPTSSTIASVSASPSANSFSFTNSDIMNNN